MDVLLVARLQEGLFTSLLPENGAKLHTGFLSISKALLFILYPLHIVSVWIKKLQVLLLSPLAFRKLTVFL